MADRQIQWSIVAKFRDLVKGAREADRALERLEDREKTLAAASDASSKTQGQNAAAVARANERIASSQKDVTKQQSRWQAVLSRVAEARKRDVEQTEAVMRARAAEQQSLAALTKAQEDHVLATKRNEEVQKRAIATEFQKGQALLALKRAYAQVTAAQMDYADKQRRTSIVVDEVTTRVNRGRTAWGTYRTEVEKVWASLHRGNRHVGNSNKVFRGFGGILLKFGTIAAVLVPVVLGLVGAVGQLVGGLYAMLSALAPAVGVLATIPQVVLGAATAIGTLVLAFGGVGDALKAQTKAEDALTEAQQKARAEMSASEQAAFDYQQALKALPKETQSFVKYLVKLKPKLKELKAAAAKGLMPGAESGLRSLMKLFPMVKTAVGDMGKVAGDSMRSLGAAVTTTSRKAQMGRLFTSNTYVAKQFASVLKSLVLITMSVADAARPLTEWLARLAAGWAKNTAKMADSREGAVKMQKFFDKTKVALQSWGNIFKNIAIGLKNIGSVGYDSGQSLTDSFEDATKRFKEWTETDASRSKMKVFFDESKKTVESIATVLKDITLMIGRLGMPIGNPPAESTGKYVTKPGQQSVSEAALFSTPAAAAQPSPGRALIDGIKDMMPTLQSIIDTLSQNMGTGVIDAIKSLLEAFDEFLKNGGGAALKVFSDVLKLLADGIKAIVSVPLAVPILAGIYGAFAAFKALKLVGAITGITSLGRAIFGFYRDARKPKGWVDPGFAGGGGGGGAYFPGGGGSGNPKNRSERGSTTVLGNLFGRRKKPPTSTAPMGFGGVPAVTQPKRRFPGAGGRLHGGVNALGSAAGAFWLASQFIDPESEAGKKAGDVSSYVSAAMFAPMAYDVVRGTGKGVGKIAGGARKLLARPGKPGVQRRGVGMPKKQTRLGRAAGAAKGAISKGTSTVVSKVGEAAGKAGSKIGTLASNFALLASTVGGKVMTGLKTFGGWLKSIVGSIGRFASAIGGKLLGALSKIGGLISKLGGWMMTLATKVLPMVGRAFMMLGRAMFMNPFGLIVLGIIALVSAFVLLYKKNETFRKFVQAAWAKIKEAISVVVDWLVNTAWPWLQRVFSNMGKVIGWLWQNIVRPYFTLIWSIFKAVFGWVLNTGWPLLQKAFGFIGKVIGWLWRNIVQPYFKLIWTIVKTVFNWILDTGWPLVQKAFKFIGDAISKVVDIFSTVKDAIGRVWSGLVETIARPIRTVVDWINRNFIGKINQLLGKLGISWRLPTIPGGSSIPKENASKGGGTSYAGGLTRAGGGYIPGNSPTKTADNIPAWLTAGEFVTRVLATRRMKKKYPGYLEHINKYGEPPKYAKGGAVVGASPIMERFAKRLNKAKGIPRTDTKRDIEHHAAGGYVGTGPSLAHAFAPSFGIGGLIGEAWDFFQDVGGFLKKKTADLLKKMGLDGFLYQIVNGVGGKALKGLAEAAREKMLSFFGEGGGGGGTGGIRYGNTGNRVRALIASSRIPGLSITSGYRSPAHNARVGGSPTSKHMNADNPAIDIGGPTSSLDAFYPVLRAVDKWAQLLWRVPGHYDHIHVSKAGGEVPAKGVLNAKMLADMVGGVPKYHAGGPVQGVRPGASGSWVSGLYRMLLLDSDATTWGGDLTTRLSRWLGGTPVAPSTNARDVWAARLKAWASGNRTKSMTSLSSYMDRGTGYMNYQRLYWLSLNRPDAWKAVKDSKTSSAQWLEGRFNAEVKERGDRMYALQKQLGFGTEGTTLDRGMSGTMEWEALNHAVSHALGKTHSAYLARPWSPRTAAELAVRAQQDINSSQAQFNRYLDLFATWGLGDLIDKLLETGIEEGLPLARSFASNRTAATDYNTALKLNKQLVSTSSPEALKFISAVSSSTEPLGIRSLARLVGLPDFGVVQMYEELLAAKRLVKGPKTARLDREVPLFRSGLFYASGGGKVPGTGTGDRVPAMLEPGEFVLRRVAAKALGMGNLQALNNLQYFADGGMVFPVVPATPALPASTASAVRRGIPKQAGAGIINIRTNIYNPVREPSTQSMHRMLRQQAAQGLFGQNMRSATVLVAPEGGS